ncbi:hypothetical protein [Actinoplanes sp. NPDC049265]|uniref:hypothetical protein n=1 Tax=Actinoplanes sp. NPDC049265 TaxID=3363902 RepID=UPI00371AC9FD
MSTTPTPDEARQALQDVERHQAETAAATGRKRWVWIASGAAVLVWGVLADQVPDFNRGWSSAAIVLVLAVSLIANSRWGGSLFRRQARPRVAYDPASMLWFLLVIAILIGGKVFAVHLHTPHYPIWAGLVGGVLLAAVGPWWQRRVLTRAARR